MVESGNRDFTQVTKLRRSGLPFAIMGALFTAEMAVGHERGQLSEILSQPSHTTFAATLIAPTAVLHRRQADDRRGFAVERERAVRQPEAVAAAELRFDLEVITDRHRLDAISPSRRPLRWPLMPPSKRFAPPIQSDCAGGCSHRASTVSIFDCTSCRAKRHSLMPNVETRLTVRALAGQ
jgi:hypothetical protein